MTPDECELLCDLKRVCNHAPEFALEFMAGNLPVAAEIAYAHRLVDVAEALLRHASGRERIVIDGHIAAIVHELRELPSGGTGPSS
jgi:hypothetical protein